jgi:hypothetical protein
MAASAADTGAPTALDQPAILGTPSKPIPAPNKICPTVARDVTYRFARDTRATVPKATRVHPVKTMHQAHAMSTSPVREVTRRSPSSTPPSAIPCPSRLPSARTSVERARDPDAGRVPFEAYAAAWIKERPLAQSTAELYGILLRVQLVPTLGRKTLAEITPAAVRSWRRARLDAGTGEPTVAKSYALLRGTRARRSRMT